MLLLLADYKSSPFPVADFRQVLAVLIDVLLMLDEFVLNHLLEISTLGADVRQAIDHAMNEMKVVQVVL